MDYRTRAQLEDARKLWTDFYRVYDHSYINDVINTGNLGRNLAEGSFFATSSVGVSGSRIAIKRLKVDQFLDARKWFEQIKRLKHRVKDDPILVPPFEILFDEDGIVFMIMPFGVATPSDLAQHWQPLDRVICDVLTRLSLRGIQILDTPQILYSNSVPFLCDFSDLIVTQHDFCRL